MHQEIEENNQKKSKKHLFIILPVALLLVFVVIIMATWFFAQITVNKTLTRINKSENDRVAKVTKDIEIQYKVNNNSENLKFDEDFNYEDNLALIIDSNIQLNKLYNELKNECEFLEGKYDVKTSIFTKIYFKEKHAKLIELDSLLNNHLNECKYTEGQKNYALFLNEMEKSHNEIAKIQYGEPVENKSNCSPLAKYANGKYKVDELNQISTIYTPKYQQVISDAINSRAVFYAHCMAIVEKNMPLSNLKFKEFQEANDKLVQLQDVAAKELKEKNKEEFNIDMKESFKTADLLRELNPEPNKTQYSSGIWSANLLYGALNLYQNESSDDAYPVANNLQELMPIIKEKVPELQEYINTDYVNYSSEDGKGFVLSFKNEIINKDYTIRY